jgi:hypothetical protein
VSRDFLPLVFFFKQLLLAPVDKHSNDFDFFRIFAEIFDYFGASPVSTTPVSDTFTVLKSFTGFNDTGNACIAGVIDTGKDMHSPVSMTLAKPVFAGFTDTVNACHRCR